MSMIDRPFRFTWDFCVVWLLLVLPTFVLTRSQDFGPWYSRAAVLILLPMFATFVLYGPVLLVRQVIGSGSRGWLVARVLVSIISVGALLLGGLLLSGFYTQTRARIIAFVFIIVATIYLHWKLER